MGSDSSTRTFNANNGLSRQRQRRNGLFAAYGRELLEELIERITRFEVIEQVEDRDARADENELSAHDFGIAVDHLFLHHRILFVKLYVAESPSLECSPMPPARDRLRQFALLDALGHAVIATDTRGRITYWSAAAAELYGWAGEEVVGRDILEVTPSDLSRAEGSEILETLRAGDVWSGDFRVRRRDGRDFLACVTDVPLLGAGGRLTGIVGLSAVAGGRTPLATMVERFVEACEELWPGAVASELHVASDVELAASDPHLVQLMALLMIPQAAAMDAGSRVKIAVRAASKAMVAEFGRIASAKAVDLSFAWSEHAKLASPLDRFSKRASVTPYAGKLVEMTGGLLLRGFDQTHWRVMHAILPRSN